LIRFVLDVPAPPPPERISVEPDVLTAYAGLYHSAQTDELIRLTARDGKLFAGATELIPTARETFVTTGGRTTYVVSSTSAQRHTVTTPNGKVGYAAVAAAKPTVTQLAGYRGTYYSEELDVAHVLSVAEGRLSVVHWPGPAFNAEPTFADSFRFGSGWHATFTRDASGSITGYELSNGRCRRVRFVRR
jgi:hypothetical protein